MSKTSHNYEVVITDSDFPDGCLEQDILCQIGASVKKYQTCDEDEVIRITQNADAILCDYAPINRNVLSHLEKNRVIVEYGAGYDNIDVKAAQEKGIFVCHVPDFMTYEVAEHSMALYSRLGLRFRSKAI